MSEKPNPIKRKKVDPETLISDRERVDRALEKLESEILQNIGSGERKVPKLPALSRALVAYKILTRGGFRLTEKKLKERSTWVGITLIASIIGVELSPDHMQEIAIAGGTAISGIVGLFELFRKEKEPK